MQALMLAAGSGSRLGKYTKDHTKCMVKVGGKTLLERTIDALRLAGIKKFVIVVGYEGEKLVKYINESFPDMEFKIVNNPDYAETNNIYSLYLAKDLLVEDDTVMIESDLIYDTHLIKDMVDCKDENLIAVAKYRQWMDGTVTLIDNEDTVTEFVEKKDFIFENADKYYKTVNIYKFSKEFLNDQYVPFLEAYIKAYGKNKYYELVLKAIAHLKNAGLKAFKLENVNWYEVDNAQDLDIANTMFAKDEDMLHAYEMHYGGYWRFDDIKDFCYLVNPYFPPKKMKDQMKYFFDTLLSQYPSGMNIQKINAGRMFGIDEDEVLIGNGAAELINALGSILKGRLVLPIPAFNEYIRCFKNCEIKPIYTSETDFCLKKEIILKEIEEANILALINPDNPSGSFLKFDDIIEIINKCQRLNVTCIIDESFIDFAQKDIRYTLVSSEIMQKYKNLIVIKSISKSYGVPGIRLGIAASGNAQILNAMKEKMSIWNINSYGEYFLQIFTLFADQYKSSCDKIAEQRKLMQDRLSKISYIKVYDSQANYIMCKITGKYGSKELANKLIKNYNILIKDLSDKYGFNGSQFIRLAVRDFEDNDLLCKALEEFDK